MVWLDNIENLYIMSARLSASRAILRVLEKGESLNDAMACEFSTLAMRDKSLAKALCYGTLRWHQRLKVLVNSLLKQPLKARDQDILLTIEMGAFELLYLQTPAYAVTAEVAGLGRALGKPWAVGLINGILRRILRERDPLCQQLDQSPLTRHALPQWLYERLAKHYPKDLEQLCLRMNMHPPMTLRVNTAHTDATSYLQTLHAAGIGADLHPHVATAITLHTPVDVSQLPGFAQGLVSVQDSAAQLAAPLLDCQPKMRVLDACAAPGGKTAHILETLAGQVEMFALDMDEQRLARVLQNLERTGYQAKLLVGDARYPKHWHDGRLFDRILLDVPCSATGVIRRHPDIKWLRRPTDIPSLATVQQQLLHALWPLLRPGGRLVYATCSVLPEENEANIEMFVMQQLDATVLPIDAKWGCTLQYGRQILTGSEGMDGFYYACLSKEPE